MSHTVGSIVRVPYPCSGQLRDDHTSITTRVAVVSIVGEKNDAGESVASVLLEDPTPICLNLEQATKFDHRHRRNTKGPFLVAPNFVADECSTPEDEQDDVLISSIQPLLSFEAYNKQIPEQTPNKSETKTTTTFEQTVTAETLKERGDALLRLRDLSAAIAYYEGALSLTSKIVLGGTVILNRGGRPVLAEIDCMEETPATGTSDCKQRSAVVSMDVTYVSDGGEGTISDQDVLLGILDERYNSDRLQERILLNLTRCCLQLSDVDVLHGRSSTRPLKYRKSAILGSSLAMACCDFFENLPSSSGNTKSPPHVLSTRKKARLLRAKAYVAMGKTKHATIDLKNILKDDSNCIDAKRLLSSLEQAHSVKKKTDRKLAKEMCTWINGATNTN